MRLSQTNRRQWATSGNRPCTWSCTNTCFWNPCQRLWSIVYKLAIESSASSQDVSSVCGGWSRTRRPEERSAFCAGALHSRASGDSKSWIKACPKSSAVRQRKDTLCASCAPSCPRRRASGHTRQGDACGRAANLPQLRRLVSGSYNVGARRRLHKPQPRTGSVPIRSGVGVCVTVPQQGPRFSLKWDRTLGPALTGCTQHSTRQTQAPVSLPSAQVGSSERQMHSMPLRHRPERYLRRKSMR